MTVSTKRRKKVRSIRVANSPYDCGDGVTPRKRAARRVSFEGRLKITRTR